MFLTGAQNGAIKVCSNYKDSIPVIVNMPTRQRFAYAVSQNGRRIVHPDRHIESEVANAKYIFHRSTS